MRTTLEQLGRENERMEAAIRFFFKPGPGGAVPVKHTGHIYEVNQQTWNDKLDMLAASIGFTVEELERDAEYDKEMEAERLELAKSQIKEDIKFMCASVIIDGERVPLIGVPFDATEQECGVCKRSFHLSEMFLNENGDAKCNTCRV